LVFKTWFSKLGDTSGGMPGDADTAASGGTDTISCVDTADSVAAEAFEVWSQIGTVPPRI
jgi:hypothetical protein